MAFRKVAASDDLWSGEMMGIEVDGRKILLANIDGNVRAYVDACPHLGTPLSFGSLSGSTLTCATHQWQFDITTGKGTNPANACLASMPVRVENGDIYLDLPDD